MACGVDGIRAAHHSLSVLRGELHALLFLTLITEPDPDHVLLQVELLGDGGDLLAGRPRLDGKVRFQGSFFRGRNGSPFS